MGTLSLIIGLCSGNYINPPAAVVRAVRNRLDFYGVMGSCILIYQYFLSACFLPEPALLR